MDVSVKTISKAPAGSLYVHTRGRCMRHRMKSALPSSRRLRKITIESQNGETNRPLVRVTFPVKRRITYTLRELAFLTMPAQITVAEVVAVGVDFGRDRAASVAELRCNALMLESNVRRRKLQFDTNNHFSSKRIHTLQMYVCQISVVQ